MKKLFVLALGVVLSLVLSCTQQVAGTDEPLAGTPSVSTLQPVYKMAGTQVIGFLQDQTQPALVYPQAWQNGSQLDATLMSKELSIPLISPDYVSVALANLPITPYNIAVAVQLLLPNGGQRLTIYQHQDKEVSAFFDLSTEGSFSFGTGDTIYTMPLQEEHIDNEGQIVRTTYVYQDGRYKLQKSIILAASPQQQMNQKATFKDQLRYLAGPWTMNNTSVNYRQILVQFDLEKNQVLFYNESMIEIFDIQSIVQTINGLALGLRNMLVHNISAMLYIDKINTDVIRLRFQNDSPWYGEYHRMASLEQDDTINRRFMVLQPMTKLLSGIYKSGDGDEMFFNYPYVTLIEKNGQEQKGRYAVFRVNGQDILEIYIKPMDGSPIVQKIYSIEMVERQEGGRTIKTLTLTPGLLSIYGLYDTDTSLQMIYEQVNLIQP
jgi:hypothetical protein